MATKDLVKILVVDDEKDLCDTIVELFQMAQINAQGVYSAQEALRVLDQEPISIVITDIRMPGKDGFYLLREIKKRNVEFPRVMFISGQPVDVETCYDRGIEGFFKKPFDFTEVKEAITRCLLRKEDWLFHSYKGSKRKIVKKFYDWQELVNSEQVGVGRIGMFFTNIQQDLEVGDLCDIKISFLSGAPIKNFIGQGVVRWTRDDSDKEWPSGVGVEIVHVDRSSIHFYTQLVASLKTTSSIPLCALTAEKQAS